MSVTFDLQDIKGNEMQRLDSAIQYYIEYESHNRLNNVRIPKDSKGASEALLYDMDRLNNYIFQRKRDEIKRIFNYEITSFDPTGRKMFLDAFFSMKTKGFSETKTYIEELLRSSGARIVNPTEARINRVISLLEDKNITILSPIYGVEDKNMHLIGCKCHIEDEILRVDEFRVNRDVLEKLMLNEVGYGIEEVLGGPQAVQERFNAIHEIVFNSYQDAKEALTKTLVEMFPPIRGKLMGDYKEFIMITLEGLNDTYTPPFKDDMQLLLTLDNRVDSNLLKKYLLHNNQAEHGREISVSSHFGSYTDEFAVNKKQWNVVCGIHQSEILAVSGPPGTGKTTLLKELIADLSVKRAKRLLENWDEEWTKWRHKDNGIFCSPFNGENHESIVVTSTNNEAVNNIGVEITKDLRALKKKLKLKLDVDFSAKLGKRENRKEFFKSNLTVLMKMLEDMQSETDISKETEEFNMLAQGIAKANGKINAYLTQRQVMHDMDLLLYDKHKISVEKMMHQRDVVESHIAELRSFIDLETEKIKVTLKLIDKTIDEQSYCVKKRRLCRSKIHDCELDIEAYVKKRSGPIAKKIIRFIEGLGGFGISLINGYYGDLDRFKSELVKHNSVLEEIGSEIQALDESLDELRIDQKTMEAQIDAYGSEIQINENRIMNYNAFFEKYNEIIPIVGEELPCVIESLEYKLFNTKPILQMRYRLFELSLIINEAYIIKHHEAIKNNLNLMLGAEGNVIQTFYRSSFKYDGKTESVIRQLWEAFCLCFPVITTTLHSFSKENFHMLEKLFDYMLVDEAGQILPYYLLAPLYRSRNVVVVGDEKQLEPIRDAKNKVYEKYEDKVSDKLNANMATAQGLANLASDYYEENESSGNVVYEGIMLEEHRRCENAIVQFANKYVYDNRMIITKEDKPKDFMESNVCFLDIRGVKSQSHVNQSEANVIGILVKKLTEKYEPSDIAVIAPYKNQVAVLREVIDNDDIQVGTVHSFQGKDKEVVVMSLTIHSERDASAKGFIGGKPNMLNVAFTRAKQQLFIVGNFSVLENTEKINYLYNVSEFIKDHGKLFSVYHSDYLESLTEEQHGSYLEIINQMAPKVDEKFEKLFRPYLNSVDIIEDKNHYKLLLNLFEEAESSVVVVCPWMTKYVVDEEYIDKIQAFQENKKEYSIVFGYKKSSDTLKSRDEIKSIIKRDYSFSKDIDEEADRIMRLKKVMGENLIYRPPLHTKAMIIDNEYLLIGSHNWLSKNGQQNGDREEMTVIVKDEGMIEYIRGKYGIA